MLEALQEVNIYYLITIIIIVITIIVYVIYKKHKKTIQFVTDEEIYDLIKKAGYSHDRHQNIFYSNLDAWQREMGYCRLYDEAAPHFSIIMDCEPIYFEYEGKRWMIEFWKGQYGIATGCEIGLYYTDKADINIPGIFTGTFYDCVDDKDLLDMQFTLQKGGKVLFSRKDKHWWLTGFRLGEFSQPSELIMYLKIKLKDNQMTEAFVDSLQKVGYRLKKDFNVQGNIVSIKYDKPYTRQPYSRNLVMDWLTQKKNKALCNKYQKITRGYENFPDKMRIIQRKVPVLFNIILNLGRNKNLYDNFKIIKNYLKVRE